MPIEVGCRCGATFRVKDHAAGRMVRCPKCGGQAEVPAAAAEFRMPAIALGEEDDPFVSPAAPPVVTPVAAPIPPPIPPVVPPAKPAREPTTLEDLGGKLMDMEDALGRIRFRLGWIVVLMILLLIFLVIRLNDPIPVRIVLPDRRF